MPRPPRVQHLDGALYYVTSRALEGATLFKDSRDYETYLELLRGYQERFGFKVFAFVLLPDHLHLCLELNPDTTISAVMHALHSRYTKYVTKRHGHTGHLFQQRFKLTLLEKAPSLLRLTGYLHTHPRRSGLAGDLRGYRWSSYQSYLSSGVRHLSEHGQAPGQASDTGAGDGAHLSSGSRGGQEVAEVLEQLGRLRPDWTYELYVQSVPEAEWDQLRRDLERPVVGSAAFVATVEQRRKDAARSAGQATASASSIGEIAPAPSSRARRREPSLAVILSAATTCVALVAVLLSAHTITFLKRTVSVLSQENQRTFASLMAELGGASGVRMASLTNPQSLSGTSWDVQIKPMFAAADTSAKADHLRFEDEKVVSSDLSAKGFPACRYTMTPQRNGAIVWETAQIGPGGEIVNWRGEWRGQAMQGVITRQLPGEPVSTYRFVGINLRQGGSGNHAKSEI